MNAYNEWNGWEKVGKRSKKYKHPNTEHHTEYIHNSKSVLYVRIVFMGLFEMNKMKMESKHKQNIPEKWRDGVRVGDGDRDRHFWNENGKQNFKIYLPNSRDQIQRLIQNCSNRNW